MRKRKTRQKQTHNIFETVEGRNEQWGHMQLSRGASISTRIEMRIDHGIRGGDDHRVDTGIGVHRIGDPCIGVWHGHDDCIQLGIGHACVDDTDI